MRLLLEISCKLFSRSFRCQQTSGEDQATELGEYTADSAALRTHPQQISKHECKEDLGDLSGLRRGPSLQAKRVCNKFCDFNVAHVVTEQLLAIRSCLE